MNIGRAFWKNAILVVLILLITGCSTGMPAPAATQPAEPAPTEPLPTETDPVTGTPTTLPSPTAAATAAPTATITPMPDLHEGPFVWSGDERPLLMAHYMPWYEAPPTSGSWGWHWTMNKFSPSHKADSWENFASHYTPLTGLYDSKDVKVLEYQVQLMKLSGIDGVIVDWYGIETFWDYGIINSATDKLFQVIKKAGLKFVICYEDQTLGHMVTNKHLKEEEVITHGQEVMRYLQDTWFQDEAYLKVDGKPVLFTFGPQYFKGGEAWKQLFSVLEPQPVFITLNDVFFEPASAGFPWPPMWASTGGVLSHDALLTYLNDFYKKSGNWDYVVGGAFPGFHDIYKEAGVSAGYGYLDALDGKTFRFTLQEALNHNPDMIQLITWNDYGEGTIIEPTVEFEYRYLEMVQEARKATGGEDFVYAPDDLRLPFELYKLRVETAKQPDVAARLDQAAAALLAGKLDEAEEIINEYR